MNLIRDFNSKKSIKSLTHCKTYLKKFESEDREYVIILGLDTKNKVIYRDICSIGTLNACIIHPREVKTAIIRSADKIIVAHNHPSGDSEPSEEDRLIHERLVDSGELLGIKVIDCVIITKNKLTSFIDKI